MSLSCLPHRLLILIAAFLLAVGSAPSVAQPSGARGENFLYRVISGDTLFDLAQRFTDNHANWGTLQTLNSVQDPYRLDIGRELKIPFALIPELPSQARVSHLIGQASVDDAPIKLGAELAEGGAIRTSPNGFITLTLADSSAVSVPAASSLLIERLRVFKGTGLIDTIFTIRDGALESHVAPQATGVGRFEVRTPVSITGVRGTRLRVRSSSNGSQTEVLSGSAQLSASQANHTTLRSDHGAAVDAQGKLLSVRPLLPAPALEQAVRGDQGWGLSFPAVPGAASYLVRVTRDEAGRDLVSNKTVNATSITFSAPGSGTHYVVVRAIDADGVMGIDAMQPFSGQLVLKTSDGSPVTAGHGQFVSLTDF